MREDKSYLVIAKNFIESAKVLMDDPGYKEEVVGFLIYHSLESVAAAFLCFRGLVVDDSHWKKLDDFWNESEEEEDLFLGIEEEQVSWLVSWGKSLRNKLLYPDKRNRNNPPSHSISAGEIKELYAFTLIIVGNMEEMILRGK